MKSRYYETELSYLRAQGREFARAHPTTAGLLAERSDDPDVERLLEGFAFLASRVHERLDDAAPGLSEQIARILVPQLTAPIPSVSIVEFKPDPRALRKPVILARGTQVAGRIGPRDICSFRTTVETPILPVALEDVSHERVTSRVDAVTLKLRTPESMVAELGRHSLRLHLHGEVPFAAGLRLWMLRHCREIAVRSSADPARGHKVTGLPKAVGLGPDARLLPQPPLAHDGFATTAELFAFPAKFAFVDLPPLGNIPGEEFEVRMSFERAPTLPKRPVAGDIRLHCAPVVNLFEATSDPVRFEPLAPESIIRVANRDPWTSEVHSVTRVVGWQGGKRVEIPAFTEFRTSGRRTSRDRYYRLRRVSSVTDMGTDSYISLMSPLDAHPVAESNVLSLDLLASNRNASSRLGIGDINLPVRGEAVSIPFTNIAPVSPPHHPMRDVELSWRLSAHVGMSRRGLQDPEGLRGVLDVYNFAQASHPSLGRLVGLWIEAIRDVRTRRLTRLFAGAPITGTRVDVVLDEANFAHVGEALLLGSALDELFARRAGLNSFNVFGITLTPSDREYTWPARNGHLVL